MLAWALFGLFVILPLFGGVIKAIDYREKRKIGVELGRWCYYEAGEVEDETACPCPSCRAVVEEMEEGEEEALIDLEEAEEAEIMAEWLEGLTEEERAAVEAMEQKHFEGV